MAFRRGTESHAHGLHRLLVDDPRRGHPVSDRSARRPMKKFVFENGLSLFFAVIFLGTLVGQSFAGQHAYNAEQHQHGDAGVSWRDYVLSPVFGGHVMENWQSEFLQFSLFILATVWLVQKGSNESKPLES